MIILTNLEGLKVYIKPEKISIINEVKNDGDMKGSTEIWCDGCIIEVKEDVKEILTKITYKDMLN